MKTRYDKLTKNQLKHIAAELNKKVKNIVGYKMDKEFLV